MIGEVLSIMKDLYFEGLTMIVVTHEMGLPEMSLIAFFLDKRGTCSGCKPKEVFEIKK